MRTGLIEKLELNDNSINILIIGGAGFIGSHLTEALLEKSGWSVLVIDQEIDKISHLVGHPRLDLCSVDYTCFEELGRVISSSDAVVSLAAICNPSLYMDSAKEVIKSNFTNPQIIADLCAKEKKWLIHLSSSEVFGRTMVGEMKRRGLKNIAIDDKLQVLNEDSAFILGPIDETRWSYASAKQLFERYLYALGKEESLAWTIIRPFNFIGPRMDYINGIDGCGIPRVLAVFMEKLLKGQNLPLVDGGEAKRVFTDIRDAVEAMIAVLTNPIISFSRILHIGNPDNEMSIKELAATIIDVARQMPKYKPAGVEHVDGEIFYGKGYADSDRRILDVTILDNLYGWRPKYSLEQTIRDTMYWFIDHYGSKMHNEDYSLP